MHEFSPFNQILLSLFDISNSVKQCQAVSNTFYDSI